MPASLVYLEEKNPKVEMLSQRVYEYVILKETTKLSLMEFLTILLPPTIWRGLLFLWPCQQYVSKLLEFGQFPK